MSLDLYNVNLISILLSIFLLLLCYQSIQFLIKESLSKTSKIFFLSRIVGILIILALFLHPVVRLYSKEKQSNDLIIWPLSY